MENRCPAEMQNSHLKNPQNIKLKEARKLKLKEKTQPSPPQPKKKHTKQKRQ
jgi:hypothetical protein